MNNTDSNKLLRDANAIVRQAANSYIAFVNTYWEVICYDSFHRKRADKLDDLIQASLCAKWAASKQIADRKRLSK